MKITLTMSGGATGVSKTRSLDLANVQHDDVVEIQAGLDALKNEGRPAGRPRSMRDGANVRIDAIDANGSAWTTTQENESMSPAFTSLFNAINKLAAPHVIYRKLVFFDLGETLEHDGSLVPGAKEVLKGVGEMVDVHDKPPILGLISDFYDASTEEEIAQRRAEYYAILEDLGIRSFFEPLRERVTISTEVGVQKPDELVFSTAIDRIVPGQPFSSALFITENEVHIAACNKLGMSTINVRELALLADVVPQIKLFVVSN